MSIWRTINNTSCYWPPKPIGLIEVIGGSYLSIKPEFTYKKLLLSLSKKNLAIHAWNYIPNLDHQSQANQAWKDFRLCRKRLEKRVGDIFKPVKLGHSLGCKLHLLAPDGGRNGKGLIALSFNNYPANTSIPFLGRISKKLNFESEFDPAPTKTMELIEEYYQQSNNLLIRFNEDGLDQSEKLLASLRKREIDNSSLLKIDGNHMTPVSTGISGRFNDPLSESSTRDKEMTGLIKTITSWSQIDF